ncbi:MAG TPA: peroxiredoxin [Thermoanaerobaculia bacterium]|nr:peroxiredoxin [Thermoanaerobaculia bacterium]
MLTVGDPFPQFRLQACVGIEEGKEFATIASDSLKGKWLVFYAYPKDFTFICPTEIVEFGRRNADFAGRDAVVIGGSTDNEFSHLAWRKSHPDLRSIPTPLVFITPSFAQQLGILHREAGAALRVTFVVDPDGVIRWVNANDLSVGRNVDEVLRVLDALQTDELCPCNWKKGEQTLGAA